MQRGPSSAGLTHKIFNIKIYKLTLTCRGGDAAPQRPQAQDPAEEQAAQARRREDGAGALPQG
jgi:hypothetical protein